MTQPSNVQIGDVSLLVGNDDEAGIADDLGNIAHIFGGIIIVIAVVDFCL